MLKKFIWLALLLPLHALPARAQSPASTLEPGSLAAELLDTTWCDGNATGRYDCGNGWTCGYPNGDTNRGCVWRRGDNRGNDNRGNDSRGGGNRGGGRTRDRNGTIWCTQEDSGYYECGNGYFCGTVNGQRNLGCVWNRGDGPRNSGGGNSGGGNSGGSGGGNSGGGNSGGSRGGNSGGGNSGGNSGGGWPACDGTATGRFDCGNGRSCGYPNGNTESACIYN